jgi:hypothetical protein
VTEIDCPAARTTFNHDNAPGQMWGMMLSTKIAAARRPRHPLNMPRVPEDCGLEVSAKAMMSMPGIGM